MTPQQVREEILASGLRGRGGAGFPTGLKWKFAAEAPSPGRTEVLHLQRRRGRPGRVHGPLGARGRSPRRVRGHGHRQLRHRGRPRATSTCAPSTRWPSSGSRSPCSRPRSANLIGDNIMGTDFSFHLKIKEGAGAFVCGEETALMQSIEGKRGMPRLRPPFPAQSGPVGAADQHQQRRDAGLRALDHHQRGRGLRRARASRSPRARRSSPSPARSSVPAWPRCPWA